MDSTGQLLVQWSNIRTIIHHFSSELDKWSTLNSVPITTDQARRIIKTNYETLRLKFQDHLDHFRSYSENPQEAPFFRQFVRTIVQDHKMKIEIL